ncbi:MULTISPECIES: YjbF family lipoprotein [Klebsiella pneumoniae complex]|uniref:YjbF family lipoprotein n=1 Tax=Klebsiella pneumoniae complex TaxID=3390273 RepID=UPI0021A74251|nr:YjbF family lipoprotein [Klebsiella variicola]UWS45708.1 YjbF family lipoprotein [Klebsiella variicola]HDH1530264.1 YjbF family lipoprotein [Klebsiella quasipneumoniae subsp. similipneumoniae]
MRYLTLLLCLLCLQACTPSQRSVGDTFKQALFGQEDVTISDAKIASLPAPYGSIYLRLPQVPRMYVAGYHEDGLDYWVTSDQVVFITQNGRLMKSLGYRDNLLAVSNPQQDPLLHAKELRDGASWTRTVRWTEKGNPLSSVVTSRFGQQGNEVLTLAGKMVACEVWQEDVSLQATGDSWKNTFWVDASSGQVRQSKQMLGAVLPVEISLLKATLPQ